MGVIHLTKEEFTAKVSHVLNGGGWNYLGDKPAIIDFFATWCGPCQALGPIFEEVANGKYADQVYFYKVDVDEEEELAARRAEEKDRGVRAFTPHDRDRKVSRSLKAYASMVSSADKGAVRIIRED